MTQATTSIDSRLIAMVGRKLYSSNPLPIIVRELLQNSVDACKRAGVEPKIKISIREIKDDWADWVVVCEDNGIGMTEEQIVNDFLCLGGKKENGDGQTGGFGIAKAAILGCYDWKVRTLDNLLSKETLETGGVIQKRNRRVGTRITVRIKENVYDSSIRKALQMVYCSDVDVHFEVYKNDSPTIDLNDPHAGLNSRDVDRRTLHVGDNFDMWGCDDWQIPVEIAKFQYTGETGYTIVRLNGLMQFQYGSRLDIRKTNLIFDVKTDADPESNQYPFSMSREELEHGYKKAIDAFVTSHNTNVLQSVAAIHEEVPEDEKIEVLTGRLIQGSRETHYQKRQRKDDSGMGNKTGGTFTVEEKVRQFQERSTAPVQLLIERYDRDPSKKVWHSKLLLAWQDILHVVAEHTEEFGIGISSYRFRRASRTILDGTIYYVLHPEVAVNEQLRKQSEEAIVLYLWGLACHEATHLYVDDHNEAFTSTEGDLQRDSAAVILRVLPEIAKRLL